MRLNGGIVEVSREELQKALELPDGVKVIDAQCSRNDETKISFLLMGGDAFEGVETSSREVPYYDLVRGEDGRATFRARGKKDGR